jgi:Tfp pilus assembly protein PilF
MTEPVRSDERTVRAFWNIAGDLGLKVGVIGWYASWPAEPVKGFLISDRLASHQVRGGALPPRSGLVYPDSLLAEIEAVRAEVEREVGNDAAARFFSAGRATGNAGGIRPRAESTLVAVHIDEERLSTFVGILRATELYRRLTPLLLRKEDPDLFAVYFEGTDAVGHLFAEYAPPAVPGADPEQVRHFGGTFDRYYEFVDAIVGEFLSLLDPAKCTLFVVSDHGFKTGDRRPATPSRTTYANQAPAWHRPEGVILMWGRGVRAGVTLPESTLYDVLPTVFRALGLPLSGTLAGKPLEAAFTQDILARSAPNVADYEAAGERERPGAAQIPSDDQIAKLRALGYIGAPSGAGDGGAGTRPSGSLARPRGEDPAGGGQRELPLNRYNEGLLLLGAGKKEEALRAFKDLQREEPGFPLGYLGEGMARLGEGNGAAAIPPLRRAIAISPQVSAFHASLGEALLMTGERDEARRELERALELEPRQGRAALLLGQSLLAGGELRRSRELLGTARQSSTIPAERAAASVALAILAEQERRLDGAEQEYRRALEEVPDFAPALERYANLELFRGRPERAVEMLSRLVRLHADSATALTLYGRALSFAGRKDEARAALRRSLALDPAQQEARSLLAELDK